MKTITGIVRNSNPNGTTSPVVGRSIYAIPSPLESQYLLGGNWSGVWSNTGLAAPYNYGIKALTDAQGAFIFSLPQLSETSVPGGVLQAEWVILDPLTGISYRGQVSDSIVSPATLKQLVDLYAWTVSSGVVAPGGGAARRGLAPFTPSSGTEVAVALVPPMPSADYVPVVSNTTDDLGTTNYTATVKAGWTNTEFRVIISDPVPAGRTVNVPYHIQG